MRFIRPVMNIVSTTGRIFAFIFFFLIIGLISSQYIASAADYPKLNNRSLTIGTTVPGATTDYILSWRYPSVTTIGSIKLEMCANPVPDDPCVNPGGDLSGATLTSQAGITGFSILSQTADEIILTRPSAGANTVQSTYEFANISNPSGVHARFFIRISTYSTTNASGTFNHFSSVTSATAEPIVINSEVPQILYFCAGITIDEWCDSVTGNYIDYGDLAPMVTDVGTSQFGVATNATGGYVVTANGDTMTSGNNTITPLTSPTANLPGVGQFGLNLMANTDPASGQDVTGDGTGVVSAGYDTPDLFQFNDGDTVATALTGTLFNTYTVTYIVNIDPDQPSGVYNTTIAYICTAAF